MCHIVIKIATAFVIFGACTTVCIIINAFFHYILQAKKKVGKDADRIYKHENQNLNIFDNQNFKRFFAARCDKLNRIADFFADERFGNRR